MEDSRAKYWYLEYLDAKRQMREDAEERKGMLEEIALLKKLLVMYC